MASWIETFQAPLHEIEERFKKSELAIVAWSSQEQSEHLRQRMKQSETKGQAQYGTPPNAKIPPGSSVPEGLPARFFNKDGELDLRGVTGMEAWQYMQAIGKRLPYIPIERPLTEKK